MLQYSTYSVISPEGCASILWKDAGRAEDAAEALGITAQRLQKLDVIDSIIDEPLGGAHRNYDQVASNVSTEIKRQLSELNLVSVDELLDIRQLRLRSYGHFHE